MLQSILQGILLGGVFALAGIGMSLIFGIVKLTNLAHGELLILAAYFSTVICESTGMHPLVSIIIVAPIMFVIGYILQRVLINRVIGPDKGDEPALLVTFGLSVILQNLMLQVFSANPKMLDVSYKASSIRVSDDLSIPVLYLLNFALCLVVIVVLSFFLNRTYMGKAIRAVSDDNDAAAIMGINVKVTYGMAMGIALATAAISGILIGTTFSFYPTTGQDYLLIAFGVVVIGGMGSIKGTFVGGIIFGLARSLGTVAFGIHYQMMAGYLIIILMLMFKPSGLFRK